MAAVRLFSVRIRGEWACFTRPELKTERVSYQVITPSAVRGVVEAVLWKPAIRWRVHRIAILKPNRIANIKRDEVNCGLPVGNVRKMMRGQDLSHYFADEDRAQRNSVVLRDVDYRVDVSFGMTNRAGIEETPLKFADMFERRLARGQCHMAPYLGCREFPAIVTPSADSDPDPINVDHDLGLMLLDIHFGRPNIPVFYRAVMKQGVIEVPAMPSRESGLGVAS